MEQFPDDWPAWLKSNLPWLGFIVMWILGGTIGHIKAWQKAGVPMTVKQHFAGLFVRLFMAAFVSFIVYCLHVGLGWDNIMISFVVAGISSVFASDFIDFLWFIGKERGRSVLGLPPEYGERRQEERRSNDTSEHS